VLTLSGTNTFTGGLTLNAGTVNLGGNAALGTGLLSLNGGALSSDSTTSRSLANAVAMSGTIGLGSALNSGSLMFTGAVSLVSAATLNLASAVTLSGVVSGGFGLSKAGAGELTLAAANTFLGNLSVSAGTLSLAGGAAVPNAASVSVVDAGTLRLVVSEEFGSLAGNGLVNLQGGTLTLSGSNAGSFSGVIAGSLGSLVKSGVSAQTLSGSNTFGGGVRLSGGSLLVGSDTALGTGTLTFTGGRLSSDSGTARSLANAFAVAGSLGLGDAVSTGTLSLTGAMRLTAETSFNVASAVTIGGSISGAFNLNKLGAGELTLSGVNTFSGSVAVSGGMLTLGGGSALANQAAVTVNSGARLNLAASEEFASLAGAGSVSLSNAARMTLSGSVGSVLSGSISGTGSILKNGASDLVLSGSSNFSGGVSLVAGSLRVGSDAALGTGTLSLSGGRLGSDGVLARAVSNALVVGGSVALGDSVSNRQGSLNLTGSGLFASDATLAVDSAVTFSGALSGTAAITKVGEGELTLSGSNTWSGRFNVNSGKLTLSGAASLPVTNVVTLATQGTLNLASNRELAAVTGTGLVTLQGNSLTISGTSDSVFAGVISGLGGLVKKANSRLVLSGANTYTGTTRVESGVLQIGAGGVTGALSTSSAIVVGGTVEFNRSDLLTQGVNFGVISGSGALVQSGSGTLAFAGTNTFTGVTIVNAGTLSLSSGVSLATSKISLKASSTLKVQDTWTLGSNVTQQLEILGTRGSVTAPSIVSGNLTLGTKATLALDSAAAVLSQMQVNGNLNLAAGEVKLRLDAPLATGFAGDAISVTGNLTLGTSTAIAKLSKFGSSLSYGRYGIMSYTGELSGFLSVDSSALGANMAASLEYNLAQKQVAAVVVDPRGFMFGWGANASGVLGGSLGAAVSSPRAFLGVDSAVQVAFGGSHALVINSSGSLYAIGVNQYGQLGDGFAKVAQTASSNAVAYAVPGLGGKRVVSAAAGARHSAAVLEDGRLFVWGSAENGRLGIGSTASATVATPVDVTATSWAFVAKKIQSVSIGANGAHTLAVDTEGNLYAWGANTRGQLGQGDVAVRNTPAAVLKTATGINAPITMAAAGSEHSLVVAGGKVYAWGRNASGEVGDGGSLDRTSPALIQGGALAGKVVRMVAAGESHSLAVDDAGNVYGWGSNLEGQLGPGVSAGVQRTPVWISSGSLSGAKVVSIAAGSGHSIALTADGKVIVWGQNTSGQLGNRLTTGSSTPQQIAVATAGLTGVVAGANNSAALGGIYFAAQPESKVGLVGSAVPVTAVARLAGDMAGMRASEITYQWTPAGSPVSTGSSSNVTVVTGDTSFFATASYPLFGISRVSNAGTVSSAPTLVVESAPTLVSAPVSSVVSSGGTVTLVVTASGNVDSFIWQKNTGTGWQNVSGNVNTATKSTLVVASVDAGSYRVAASNSTGALLDGSGKVVTPEAVVRTWSEMAGTYQALLKNAASPVPEGDSASDLRYAGRVTLTVSATSSFSGVLDYQGQSLTLVGSFNPNGTSTVTVSRGALPSVSFQLSIGDLDAKNLTITAASTETLRSAGTTGTAWFEQSSLSPTTLNASGTLKRTSPASTIASKNFGAVLATFEGTAARTSGHAVFMVSSTGLVKIAGRFGDGSDAAMTASTYLMSDDTAAIYKAIGTTGHLAGSVRLRVVDTASTDNNAVQPADGDWELKTTVARRVRPFGSLYTAPTSVTSMTATTMLGAASATVANFGAYTTAGATLPAALGIGTWGLRVATVIVPNTSVDDAWKFSGGTQMSTLNAASEVSLTPSPGSPLRTLSLKVTSSGVVSTRSGTGVVLQNDVWQGGVKLPKGTYGVTLNGSDWIEWCVR
jgi:autotransporter-associated beta strand protein